jgi:hypothetical protein
MHRLLSLVILLPVAPSPWLVGTQAPAGTSAASARLAAVRLPVSFEVNRGQADRRVAFIARGSGLAAYLTRDGAYLVPSPTCASAPRSSAGRAPMRPPFHCTAAVGRPTPLIRLTAVGARPHPRIAGEDRLPGMVNYFRGSNPAHWHTGIATYAAVIYRDLYAGIDERWHSSQGAVEYDWVVHPGADPDRIQLRVSGGTPAVDRRGQLLVRLPGGQIVQQRPRIYQLVHGRRHVLAGSVRLLAGRRIAFSVAGYDRHRPLIIDPTLTYSVDLGGSDGSRGLGIAVDRAGNAYVTGATQSDNFPLKQPLQDQTRGDEDVFVSKLNSDGTGLLYSTYIGGHQNDEGIAIAVDSTGAAYVTGETLSVDYPTIHALQSHNRSTCTAHGVPIPCDDVLLTKLSPAGSAIEYSTYLGGNNGDEGYGIAVGGDGSAYLAGKTDSDDFPTAHAIQPRKGSNTCLNPSGIPSPCTDGFIAKFSPSGTSLIYSTYLGGRASDEADGIAVDRLGAAYVVGTTYSPDFPLTNPLQGHRRGAVDGFVAQLDSAGSRLVYSTYLGGRAQDSALNVAVHARSAYVTGFTNSRDFPVVRPLRAQGRGLEAFVTRIKPGGTGLQYSTYIGGKGDDEALGIAVDRSGDTSITGDTDSPDFPSVDAVQQPFGGSSDAFMATLNPAGDALLQSTYLGGRNLDYGDGIALDPAGDAYITGFTFSLNFPAVHGVPGAEGSGAFIARIDR